MKERGCVCVGRRGGGGREECERNKEDDRNVPGSGACLKRLAFPEYPSCGWM